MRVVQLVVVAVVHCRLQLFGLYSTIVCRIAVVGHTTVELDLSRTRSDCHSAEGGRLACCSLLQSGHVRHICSTKFVRPFLCRVPCCSYLWYVDLSVVLCWAVVQCLLCSCPCRCRILFLWLETSLVVTSSSFSFVFALAFSNVGLSFSNDSNAQWGRSTVVAGGNT